MFVDKPSDKAVVSIIMPVYNAETFLESAILSVINQTMQNWELLVIDDGSSDRSLEIAEKYARKDSRICILRNEKNMGVAKTRNRGIELSKGEYIALLDSDDVWYPQKLACQLARIKEKNADFCYSSYAIIGADGNKVKADYVVPETLNFEELLRENVICCSSVLVRSEILRKLKFETDFYHEDYILGLQVLKNGYLTVGCTQQLLGWRYIENSRSFNKWKSAKNRWKIYREYLKLSLGKSIVVFGCYAFAGLRKYGRKNQ